MDLRCNRGYTPLMLAAGGGNNEGVAILLKHGADVNGRGRDGVAAHESPLLIALRKWNVELARLLIHHGADVAGTMRKVVGLETKARLLKPLEGCFLEVDPKIRILDYSPDGRCVTVTS